jgi:hypothetical protein
MMITCICQIDDTIHDNKDDVEDVVHSLNDPLFVINKICFS